MLGEKKFERKGPKRSLLLSLLFVAALVFAACAGFDQQELLAEEAPAITKGEPAEEPSPAEEAAPGAAEELIAVRASGLIGNNIMSKAMKELGQVEDVIVNVAGNASYAIISSANAGPDERVVLPLATLRYSADQETFLFAEDESSLPAAARLLGGEQPDLADPTWGRELAEFWNEVSEEEPVPAAGGAAADSPAGVVFIRASDLLDNLIVSETRDVVGRVLDIVVSVRPDGVDYAVLSVDSYAGVVDRFFAIPLPQLNLADIEEDMVRFKVEEEIVRESPEFDPDDFSMINFPQWDEEFVNYWESAALGAASSGGQIGIAVSADPVVPLADEFALSISELLGYKVTNARGQQLGQVEDLIMGRQSHNLLYAVVTLENLPGSGDELIPAPLAMMNIDPAEKALIFNVTDPVIAAAAPRFSRDNWPDLSQEGWGEDWWRFWNGSAAVMAVPPAAPTPVLTPDEAENLAGEPIIVEGPPGVGEPGIRLSELLAYDIVNAQGQKLGQVDDLMMEIETRRVTYVIPAFDAAVAVEAELVPIPWQVLELEAGNQTLALEASGQALQNAPGFARTAGAPDTTEPDWDAAIRAYWLSR